jgi:hypothetical protein
LRFGNSNMGQSLPGPQLPAMLQKRFAHSVFETSPLLNCCFQPPAPCALAFRVLTYLSFIQCPPLEILYQSKPTLAFGN